MSDKVLGPGPHTRVRRLPEKARYDEDTINAILDEARFCTLAGVVDGLARHPHFWTRNAHGIARMPIVTQESGWACPCQLRPSIVSW